MLVHLGICWTGSFLLSKTTWWMASAYIFKQIYLTLRWNLTGTTSSGQNGSGSDGRKRIFHSPQNCSLKIRYSIVSYSRHPIFVAGVLPLCTGHSRRILRPTKRITPHLEDCSYALFQIFISSKFILEQFSL